MMNQNKRPICVTGCGSSGTAYISAVLRTCGLDVPHEKMGADGIASWLLAPGTPDTLPGFDDFPARPIVLHQVRHPLRAVSTFQRTDGKHWDYIYRHMPTITPDMPLIERCMRYWVEWNDMAAGLAEWTYRVETVCEWANWKRFCLTLQRHGLVDKRHLALGVPVNVNSKPKPGWYRELSWADLVAADGALARVIMGMGRKYGYAI